MRLTVEDFRALTALTRYGVLSWRQVKASFYGGSQYRTTMRVAKLRESGYIRRSVHEGWSGHLLWAAQPGVSMVSTRLRVPLSAMKAPPQEQLLHRLAVSDIGLEYEARGAVTLTEREVRVAEPSPKVDAGQVVAGLGGQTRSVPDLVDPDRLRYLCTVLPDGARVHYPDLVVATQNGLRAVEVELVVKEWSRLSSILRGYRDSSPFTSVFYFCTPEVMTAFLGWWELVEGQRRWHDGWLQRLAMLPSGVHVRPPSAGGDMWRGCPIRVFPLQPTTPDIQYRLDMRQVAGSLWMDKREWARARAIWDEDPSSTLPDGTRMPFYLWLKTTWEGLQRERAARYGPAGDDRPAGLRGRAGVGGASGDNYGDDEYGDGVAV